MEMARALAGGSVQAAWTVGNEEGRLSWRAAERWRTLERGQVLSRWEEVERNSVWVSSCRSWGLRGKVWCGGDRMRGNRRRE